MSAQVKKWGLWWLSLWLAACAASGPEVREPEGERPGLMEAWVAAAEEEGEACEEQDACVTLVFRIKGINIHSHTMVVERVVHNRIHRGPEGGPWNAEWDALIKANDGATQAQIWEQAVKMIFRYKLTSPIVPYHWRVRPQPLPSDAR